MILLSCLMGYIHFNLLRANPTKWSITLKIGASRVKEELTRALIDLFVLEGHQVFF